MEYGPGKLSRTGPILFKIMIDGVVIVRERLVGTHPGVFFDRTYDIPSDPTRDKARVTVRFEPEATVSAGPVFGVRLIRRG